MADDIRCHMSDAEFERIRWLTKENLKRLGRRYKKAAEEMAVFQVSMEHAARALPCHAAKSREAGET